MEREEDEGLRILGHSKGHRYGWTGGTDQEPGAGARGR